MRLVRASGGRAGPEAQLLQCGLINAAQSGPALTPRPQFLADAK
jgi:hypothetical protein